MLGEFRTSLAPAGGQADGFGVDLAFDFAADFLPCSVVPCASTYTRLVAGAIFAESIRSIYHRTIHFSSAKVFMFWPILFGFVVTCLMFTFLLAIHEFSHVAVMKIYGITPERVVIGWPTVIRVKIGGVPHQFGLLPLFGYAYCEKILSNTTPRVRAIIALSGPVGSMLLGWVLLIYAPIGGGWICHTAGMASMMIAAMNLIPLPPMDGWHILTYVLSKKGVVVSDTMQRILLGMGIFVAILSVFVVQHIDAAFT